MRCGTELSQFLRLSLPTCQREDFFSMYFFDSNLGPPVPGPSKTLDPHFNKYLPNFKHLSQVVLMKIFIIFLCISVVGT